MPFFFRSGNQNQRLRFESLEVRRLLDARGFTPDIPDAVDVATLEVASAAVADSKPRLIVLTDIGSSDPDDEQSMVRLLTYANEFQIEGLIAGSTLQGQIQTREYLIEGILDQYAQIQPNLALHDSAYPSVEYLRERTVAGQPRGDTFGDDFDTPGSELIIRTVDAADSRPVNIAIWGGSSDLAQALWKIRRERSAEDVAEFVSKLRVAWIEQDTTAGWITSNFPELWVVSNVATDNGFVHSPFRGMYLGGDTSTTSVNWVREHIKPHSPWGDVYPLVAIGGEMKEGDTPTWFYFLENGLNSAENPDWGGWGGRYEAAGPFHRPLRDFGADGTTGRNTVNRWREDFQSDFAARMTWSTQSVAEANHNPIAVIDAPTEFAMLQGKFITISAAESYDPDGNDLSYEWFQYVEAGSYDGEVSLIDSDSATLQFTTPTVEKSETVHLILRVRDNATLPMVAYQRVVVTVEPYSVTDVNQDGEVGFGDFLVLSTNFGNTVTVDGAGDLDGDNLVAFSDFLIYSNSDEVKQANDEEDNDDNDVTAHSVVDPPSLFQRFLVLSTNYGSDVSGDANGDHNDDGRVDFADFLILGQSEVGQPEVGQPDVGEPSTPGVFELFLVLSNNFGNELGGEANGDLNGNGSVGFEDFLALRERV